LPNETDRIVWFHRNEKSVYSLTMKLQGLESLLSKFADPLLHRTFGGAIKGEGLIKETSTTLKTTTPRRRYSVSIYPLTRQTETRDEWLRELSRSIDRVDATNIERAREAHQKWWKEFWDRSWIRVSGASPAPAMTTNTLPLRIGADSDGRNQFVGRIREPVRMECSGGILRWSATGSSIVRGMGSSRMPLAAICLPNPSAVSRLSEPRRATRFA
jgi:hypothetical protein